MNRRNGWVSALSLVVPSLAALLLAGAAEAQQRRQEDPHAEEWRRFDNDIQRRDWRDDRAYEQRQREREERERRERIEQEERERRERWEELRRERRHEHHEPPPAVIIVPPPAPVYRQPAPCQVMRPAYNPQGEFLGEVCVR